MENMSKSILVYKDGEGSIVPLVSNIDADFIVLLDTLTEEERLAIVALQVPIYNSLQEFADSTFK